jgi:hypothetical protein
VKKRDPVDDLEHDVGVASEAPDCRPRRAREDGQPRTHPVDLEALVRARDPLGARVRAGDHRDAVAAGDPARDLPEQDGPRASGLRVRPVAIREDQDVPGGRHAGATVPSPVMPARPRIAAFIAILALAAPPAALAQSDDGGGAGDSQYQDPFGSSTPAQPSAPAPRQPARQQPAPQPTPDHTAPAPAATAPAAQTQAQAPQTQAAPAQTLPRTGFDVLPVAAAGLVLLVGGLALWRRPHADR